MLPCPLFRFLLLLLAPAACGTAQKWVGEPPVTPDLGIGLAGGWDPKIIVGALLLNGAWGLGVALLTRALNRMRFRRARVR